MSKLTKGIGSVLYIALLVLVAFSGVKLEEYEARSVPPVGETSAVVAVQSSDTTVTQDDTPIYEAQLSISDSSEIKKSDPTVDIVEAEPESIETTDQVSTTDRTDTTEQVSATESTEKDNQAGSTNIAETENNTTAVVGTKSPETDDYLPIVITLMVIGFAAFGLISLKKRA